MPVCFEATILFMHAICEPPDGATAQLVRAFRRHIAIVARSDEKVKSDSILRAGVNVIFFRRFTGTTVYGSATVLAS